MNPQNQDLSLRPLLPGPDQTIRALHTRGMGTQLLRLLELCSWEEPTFRALRVFALLMALFWAVGLPGLVFWILRRWGARTASATRLLDSDAEFLGWSQQ